MSLSKTPNFSRRKFVKNSIIGGASLTVLPFTAKSYGRIIGSNDHINFAVAGLNGRGQALIQSAAGVPNASIGYLCDVDSRTIAKSQKLLNKLNLPLASQEKDYRRLMENPEVDAVAIASPDHWHAPMAIMAAKAGKNVYVEKPCCHNPSEGEFLVQVQKEYGTIIQMGNQQRSGVATKEGIRDIHNGIIGTAYMGKAWYANKRGSIGVGKNTPVPEWLDWDLWQGPAPRIGYKDNIVHYNWHWFWNWGTGEINNNGTHEIDICRWALGVKFPVRVTSSGGRYHFKDDWEFYDTQLANFEFQGGKMITWEGKSCNNHAYFKRGRGVTIHGTEGTVLLDRNGYTAYNQEGEEIKFVKEGGYSGTTDLVGLGDLDKIHMNNFANAIRKGETLNADIEGGYISNLLPHLGNMAQECGGALDIDPANGHVISNSKAQAMWSREYELGWGLTEL